MLEDGTKNESKASEQQKLHIPADVLSGEKPYISKSGKTLSPAKVKAMQNLLRKPPPGPRPSHKGPLLSAIMLKIGAKKLCDKWPKSVLSNLDKTTWTNRFAEALVLAMYEAAIIDHDMTAAKALLDRIDGPVSIKVTGPTGEPVEIRQRILNIYAQCPEAREHIVALADLSLEEPKTQSEDKNGHGNEIDPSGNSPTGDGLGGSGA
jgi:hypothetical protein